MSGVRSAGACARAGAAHASETSAARSGARTSIGPSTRAPTDTARGGSRTRERKAHTACGGRTLASAAARGGNAPDGADDDAAHFDALGVDRGAAAVGVE